MTPREVEALDFIREMNAAAGVSPTLAQIGHRIRVSTSMARGVVNKLVRDGAVVRRPGQHRGLTVAAAPDLRLAPTAAITAELARRGVRVVTQLPIATGRGAASCAADTCGAAVRVGHMMCRDHWFAVPRSIREGLLAASRAGEAVRFEQLLTRAKDIADGLTPEARAERAA